MASVERKNQCPTCKTFVLKSHPKYIACAQKLKWLFPPFEMNEGATSKSPEDPFIDFLPVVVVEVVMLNGDKTTIAVRRSDTVTDFKEKIKKTFGVEVGKQRLMCNDQLMEVSLK